MISVELINLYLNHQTKHKNEIARTRAKVTE